MIYEFEDAIVNGIPLDKNFPYQPVDGVPCTFDKSGLRIKLARGTGVDLCVDPDFVLPGFRQRQINKNIRNMKAAIMSYGVILGTLDITENLINYDASVQGIFSEDNNNRKSLGQHAIAIIGWSDAGENKEEPGFNSAYWIIRNSYSQSWGVPARLAADKHSHFAYIAMGCNQNLIESRASICQVVTPACLMDAVKKTKIEDCCYKSYTEYVNDGERKYFIDALKNK